MKKILLSLAFLISIASAICQDVKITEMPTALDKGLGSWVPIVQDGVNKKILTDSLLRELIAGKLLYIDTIGGKQRLNVDSSKLQALFGGGGGGGGKLQDAFDASIVATDNPIINTGANNFIISGGNATTPTLTIQNSSTTDYTGVGIKVINTDADGISISLSGIGIGVNSIVQNGTGVSGFSFNGIGVLAVATGGIPFESQNSSAFTNTIEESGFFSTASSVNVSNGIGTKVDFAAPTSSGGLPSSPVIGDTYSMKWIDAAFASRTSEINITGVDNAVTESWLNIGRNGILRIKNLTDTLATLADIRIGGGGGGANIGNSDLTVTGNRILQLAGNTFDIRQSTVPYFHLDPVNNTSILKSVDFSDGAEVGLQLLANPDNTNFVYTARLYADDIGSGRVPQLLLKADPTNDLYSFNLGVTGVDVFGISGTTTDATIAYKANIHAFTGAMIFNNVDEYTDNAAALGASLSVGTVYRTGDDLKIVH